MGKKIIGVIAFAAIAAAAGWNYNQNNQKVELLRHWHEARVLIKTDTNTLQNQDLVARDIHTNINVVMFGQIANINSI